MTTALQMAFDAIPYDCEPLIAAKVRGLMRGYDARWHDANFITESTEQYVEAPLANIETNRSSRTFVLGGVIDVVGWQHERKMLIDHKSTSQDISDPNAPYWRQLQIEGQASQYMLLEWMNGRKVDGAIWDVMRKPQISPKKLSKAERASVVATHKYFDYRVSLETLNELQVEERETLEMYESRLSHDCTHERPEWYFQRRPVMRLDSEMYEYAKEVWDHGQEIIQTRANNRHVRNPGACMLYGTPCKFLGICSGHDMPDSDKWRTKQCVHNELTSKIEGSGKDILTNSRIRCFQTCKRKHFYEYELGIEKQDEEEREALLFGTVWHLALSAWFDFFKGEPNGDNNQSPASGVGNYGNAGASAVTG